MGGVTCDNADLCAYLVDILGTKYPGEFDIKYYAAALFNSLQPGLSPQSWLEQYIDYLKAAADHATVQVNATVDRIGTDNVDSHTLFELLNLAKSDAHSAYVNTNTLLTNLSNLDVAVGYTAHSPATLYADIQTIKSGLTTMSSTLITLLTDIVNVQTTLSNVALGIVASWPKSAGGDLIQAIGDWLTSQKTGPGIAHLTVGSYSAIVNQQVDSFPHGAYGCRIQLTVPSTWGRLNTWPFYYTPPVARIDYANTGFYGFDPLPVNTDFILCYPFPEWADSMVLSLGVGVTAERAWLTL